MEQANAGRIFVCWLWLVLVAQVAGLGLAHIGVDARSTEETRALSAATLTYDARPIARVDTQQDRALPGGPSLVNDVREHLALRSVVVRRTSMTAGSARSATNTVNLNTGNVSVYTSTNLAGDVDYVGITNNVARRGAEHLAEKGITINEIPGLTSLSRADARAVEQVLIEANGGPGGGQLLNKINSIAASNPAYASSIQRGCQLLAAVSYSVQSSVCP